MSQDKLKDEIAGLVEHQQWDEIRRVSRDSPPAELADVLSEIEGTERVLFFRSMAKEQAREVFSHLSRTLREELLQELTDEEMRGGLADMDPDDRTRILTELPGPVVQRLLNILPPGELDEARQLLGYPEESVGRLMTPDYFMIRPDWTVGRSLEHIRRRGTEYETVNTVYIVDGTGKLLDVLALRRLLMSDPETPIRDLVRGPVIQLNATDDREAAVTAMSRYDLSVLPVVDDAGHMLGIVTYDDVMDVAEEEVTEDFHKMAPIGLMKVGLKEAGIALLWRARVGWLLVLVFMNIFSCAGIQFFEDTLAATLSLAFFLPLLINSGGNAGSQAATLMVRALATGDVRARDWMRLLAKEVAVALALGLTMALGVAAIAAIRAPEVLVVVSITMVCVVLVGSLIGTLLPFVLTRFGLDPATASAPLITSLADIAGVLIYFSIATWVLGVAAG